MISCVNAISIYAPSTTNNGNPANCPALVKLVSDTNTAIWVGIFKLTAIIPKVNDTGK